MVLAVTCQTKHIIFSMGDYQVVRIVFSPMQTCVCVCVGGGGGGGRGAE